MALKLKLISELHSSLDDFEILEEQKDLKSPSTLYISGPFLMAEGINKNKRRYQIHEMRNEVNRYLNEMVTPGRAMGQLGHPSHAEIDLKETCHVVTQLTEDNNVFYGKSKVLSTPCGQILRSLINDGIKIGVSSRCLGSLKESSDCNIVENMHLVAIDVVADPSFPKAFVNGILEAKQWYISDDGSYEEQYDNFEKAISTLPKHDVDNFLRDQILKFINTLC